MGSFIGAVSYYGLYFEVLFYQFVVYTVEDYAAMYIFGGYFYFQNISVLVAGRMGFVSHQFLVVTFCEHSCIRVGSALGNGFLFWLPFPAFSASLRREDHYRLLPP